MKPEQQSTSPRELLRFVWENLRCMAYSKCTQYNRQLWWLLLLLKVPLIGHSKVCVWLRKVFNLHANWQWGRLHAFDLQQDQSWVWWGSRVGGHFGQQSKTLSHKKRERSVQYGHNSRKVPSQGLSGYEENEVIPWDSRSMSIRWMQQIMCRTPFKTTGTCEMAVSRKVSLCWVSRELGRKQEWRSSLRHRWPSPLREGLQPTQHAAVPTSCPVLHVFFILWPLQRSYELCIHSIVRKNAEAKLLNLPRIFTTANCNGGLIPGPLNCKPTPCSSLARKEGNSQCYQPWTENIWKNLLSILNMDRLFFFIIILWTTSATNNYSHSTYTAFIFLTHLDVI